MSEDIEEEEIEEEVELTAEESDAQYQTGFDKVMGESSTAAEEVAAEEEPEPGPEPDEEREKLEERLRRMDGTIGGLKDQLKQSRELYDQRLGEIMSEKVQSETVDEPSGAQIAEAMRDPEAMQALMEDYPAFAPLGEEVKALRQDLAQQSQLIDQKITDAETRRQQQAQMDEAARAEREEREKLSAAHGDWEKTVQSTEFVNWALERGPAADDYNAVCQQFRSKEPGEVQEANDVVNSWSIRFPEWWEQRGKDLFGETNQSIKLLDDYKGTSEKESERERRQKRIESTTVPTGRGGKSAPGMNDNQAFTSGFDKIMKGRNAR